MKLIKMISKVERTPIAALQGMVRVSRSEVRLPEHTVWEAVEIKPHAQLVITDKRQDKNVIWSARLTFKTCQTFDDRDRYAYLCHLLGGQRRLIGIFGRPYPVASVQESMPENVTDNQLNEVTVSWDSPCYIPSVCE